MIGRGGGRYYSVRRNSLLRRTLTQGRRTRMHAYHSEQEVANGESQQEGPIPENDLAPYSDDADRRLEL